MVGMLHFGKGKECKSDTRHVGRDPKVGGSKSDRFHVPHYVGGSIQK